MSDKMKIMIRVFYVVNGTQEEVYEDVEAYTYKGAETIVVGKRRALTITHSISVEQIEAALRAAGKQEETMGLNVIQLKRVKAEA